MASNRIQSIDLLKLFAIFLVIYGHSLADLISVPHNDQPMYRFIYSFHMPLFMALSGFFAQSLSKYSFTGLLRTKGRQLLIPAFFMTVVALAVKFALGDEIAPVLLYAAVWFLKSLFCCVVVYYLVARSGRYRMALFVATLIISQGVQTLSLSNMYPCFLFGALVRSRWAWVKAHSLALGIGSLVVFVALLPFLQPVHFEFMSTTHAVRELIAGRPDRLTTIFTIRVYRLAIGLAGTLFFIILFDSLFGRADSKVAGRLSRFGQQTLGVYILQTLFLEILMEHYVSLDSLDLRLFTFVVAPAISLGILVFTLWLAGLCGRHRLTSLLFLGK